MRTLLIGILFLFSCCGFGQISVNTGLHCGTNNKKALEYFNSGNFGLQTNRLEGAIKLYYGAVSLDSTFCDAWDNLAVCYRKLERYDDAFNSSIRSLMIDSTNVTAWVNCGNVSFLQNDIYKALTSFDNLQRIVPDNPEGYYGKSIVLYAIDSLFTAKENLGKAEQIYKENRLKIGSEVYLLKGLIEFKIGDKVEAQRIFEKIYSKFKNNAELNYFLGVCLRENENNSKKSQRYINKAIKLGYVSEK